MTIDVLELVRPSPPRQSGVSGSDVVSLRPLRLDLSVRIGPTAMREELNEDEWNPFRGGGGGGGGGGGSRSRCSPVRGGTALQSLFPVRERIARLADGAQPAVLKIVSYASLGPGGGARSLVSYITRQGDVPGIAQDGRMIDGPAAASATLAEWQAYAPMLKRTFVTLDVTGSLNLSQGQSSQVAAASVCREIAPDRDHAFAVRFEGDDDGESSRPVRILLVAALSDRSGRRLTLGPEGRDALACAAEAGGLSGVQVRYRRSARSEDEIAARLDMLAQLSPDRRVLMGEGRVVATETGRRHLAARWVEVAEVGRKRRDVMHMALSSRAGTDPEAFAKGIEAFLDQTFPGHARLVAIHGPEDVEAKRTDHVHAHVVLLMHGPERKIRTSPAVLHAWRQAFAEALCEQGIATVATRRHDLAHAPAYEAKHARRTERQAGTPHDAGRVSAKQDRHAASPRHALGKKLAADAAKAWDELAGRPEEGRRAQRIYEELTVARFVAARIDAETVGRRMEEVIMSLERQIERDAERSEGVHPSAAALTASFGRIEATLAESRDREALRNVLVRVLDVAQETRRENEAMGDGSAESAQEAGGASSTISIERLAYTSDDVARGDGLLDAVGAAEQPGRQAFFTYQERLEALTLAPWDEDRQANARAALLEVSLADARLNRAASAVALEAAHGNAYLEHLIDVHADDPDSDQALVRMRAFVREAALGAQPPEDAEAALLTALKEDGPSPAAAAELRRIDDLIAREQSVEVLRAEANPTTRYVYDPIGQGERPRLTTEVLANPAARSLLADVQRSEDAITRLEGETERAFEAVEADPSDAEAKERLKGFALDLERNEDLYRDRLALAALGAAQGDGELSRAIDRSAADGLKELRDHISTHRLHEQPDAVAAVLAAVRDDICTPRQDARWERYEVLTYDKFRRTDQTLWKDHVHQDGLEITRTDHRNVTEIKEERAEGQGTPVDARDAAVQEGENQKAYDTYLRAAREDQDRYTAEDSANDRLDARGPNVRHESDQSGAERRSRPVDEEEM